MDIEQMIRDAAEQRAAHYRASGDRPARRRAAEDTGAPRAAFVPEVREERAPTLNADGTATVFGMASVTERGYEMWDMFGPYTEVVALDAFDSTLAADPLVEFTLNHARGGQLPMAHTRNGTLTLTAVKTGDVTGLSYEALVDPSRADVADALKAWARGDLAEASFKFLIVRGQWSPDYMEFRINEVDLNRGDVSACNFGANPLATSGVRSLDDDGIGELAALVREEIRAALDERAPVTFEVAGDDVVAAPTSEERVEAARRPVEFHAPRRII